MCFVLISAKPSLIPLSCKHCLTCRVMFINARRVGTSNQSSLRKLFIAILLMYDRAASNMLLFSCIVVICMYIISEEFGRVRFGDKHINCCAGYHMNRKQ